MSNPFTSSQALAEISAQPIQPHPPAHAWQSPVSLLVGAVFRGPRLAGVEGTTPPRSPPLYSLSFHPSSLSPTPPPQQRHTPSPQPRGPPPPLDDYAEDLAYIIGRFFEDRTIGAPLSGELTTQLFEALTMLHARMERRT